MTVTELAEETRRFLVRTRGLRRVRVVPVSGDAPGVLALFEYGPDDTVWGVWMDVDPDEDPLTGPNSVLASAPDAWAADFACWLEEELLTGLTDPGHHVPRSTFVELHRPRWGAPTLPDRLR